MNNASKMPAAGGPMPLKPKGKIKRKSGAARSKSPLKGPAPMDIEQELDELESTVSVRVREREPSSPEGRSRSRIGALLRDPSPANIKESIKRPLSGFLKRPGSRSGSKDRSRKEPKDVDLVGETLIPSESDEPHPPPPMPQKKTWFMGSDGSRPGTGFGRRFSFSRSKKSPGSGIGDGLAEELDEALLSHQQDSRRGALVQLPDADRDGGQTPEIPSLEVVDGAEFGTQVAQAPSVAVNRVATYRELDNELMKQTAFASLGDIDLSLLTRFLCPETEVRDEEVPWTWDYLYTGVCSELRAELKEEEEENDLPDDSQELMATA